jgi:GH24 family phage-related lysozyme (muramidase)
MAGKGKGQATAQAALGANDSLSMSADARARMRRREVDVYNYYDDGGPGKGHCTWGAGILAHRGPCTKEELAKPVSQAEIDAEFSRRVAKAERQVRGNVKKQALNQDQFDALVSLTYNAGSRGSRGTYQLVDQGDFKGAAANIRHMIKTTINGKKVVARGLISRRAEESAPFAAPDAAKK